MLTWWGDAMGPRSSAAEDRGPIGGLDPGTFPTTGLVHVPVCGASVVSPTWSQPRKALKKPSRWSIRPVGQKGGGKRTPVITSPLSSDLTGVRFQRRVPNSSLLATYHSTGRGGVHKHPRVN